MRAAARRQDPFDGAHLKSFTRDGQSTVSGTRFARWRWEAPAGTGITQVRGTWWHTLHDGMEQRIGVGTWSGGFDAVRRPPRAPTPRPRDFVAGFNPAQPALEDRLLCAKAESKWCSLEPGSWSAIRALTITVEDDQPPGAGVRRRHHRRGLAPRRPGRQLLGERRRRRRPLRRNECRRRPRQPDRVRLRQGVDRRRMARHADAPLRPRRLPAAPPSTPPASVTAPTASTTASPTSPATAPARRTGPFYVDNNPPAHPRNLALAGGEGWRRANDFDLAWVNPDQGVASAIGGASWRIEGPAGYDTGRQVRARP